MAEVVNLTGTLAGFEALWSQHIVAGYDGNDVMSVKVQGEFVWHSRPDTDDFFLVPHGEIDIQMRDRTVTLRTGGVFVVPAGAEHRPVAWAKAHLRPIGPRGTPGTGDPAVAAASVKVAL